MNGNNAQRFQGYQGPQGPHESYSPGGPPQQQLIQVGNGSYEGSRYNVWDSISQFHLREERLEQIRKTCHNIKTTAGENIRQPECDLNETYNTLKALATQLIEQVKLMDEFGQQNAIKKERGLNRNDSSNGNFNHPHAPSPQHPGYQMHTNTNGVPPPHGYPMDYQSASPNGQQFPQQPPQQPPPLQQVPPNGGNPMQQGPSNGGNPMQLSQENPFVELVWSNEDKRPRVSKQTQTAFNRVPPAHEPLQKKRKTRNDKD